MLNKTNTNSRRRERKKNSANCKNERVSWTTNCNWKVRRCAAALLTANGKCLLKMEKLLFVSCCHRRLRRRCCASETENGVADAKCCNHAQRTHLWLGDDPSDGILNDFSVLGICLAFVWGARWKAMQLIAAANLKYNCVFLLLLLLYLPLGLITYWRFTWHLHFIGRPRSWRHNWCSV